MGEQGGGRFAGKLVVLVAAGLFALGAAGAGYAAGQLPRGSVGTP